MKKYYFIASIILAIGATSVNAQDAPSAKQKTITFNSEKEKNDKVKELENKIKIDESDPSFPSDELKKEKAQLAEFKKAKVISTKTTTK